MSSKASLLVVLLWAVLLSCSSSAHVDAIAPPPARRGFPIPHPDIPVIAPEPFKPSFPEPITPAYVPVPKPIIPALERRLPGSPGGRPSSPGSRPSKPDNPDSPDEPGSIPDRPNTPTKPNTPDQPTTPDKPSTPDQPNTNPNAKPGSKPSENTQDPPRQLPELPEEEGLIADDASVFSLGSYKGGNGDGQEQVLFENFDSQSGPFFSKMYDFFVVSPAHPTAYIDINANPYEKATGSLNPFSNGARPTGQRLTFQSQVQNPSPRTVTSLFDPKQPKDVCRAWKSLATYCGDAGTACGCYSGTYYVPDQWNSLAAGCAVLTTACGKRTASGGGGSAAATDDAWCSMAQTASSFVSYCPQASGQVKFAQVANMPTPSGSPATTTMANPYVTPWASRSYPPQFEPTGLAGNEITSGSERLVESVAIIRSLGICGVVSLMALVL